MIQFLLYFIAIMLATVFLLETGASFWWLIALIALVVLLPPRFDPAIRYKEQRKRDEP